MLIDTHCHIDLYRNSERIIKSCVERDVVVISMTNLPSHFEMGYPYFQSLKKIRLALGMHPLMAESHKREYHLFLKNLDKTSYIGEVGLDFSKEGISTKGIQIETFSKILQVITGQKKIVSIHSRKAEKEVLELLIKYQIKNAIFHWYSGGLNLINNISEAGYYFSINPSMIKSISGQKIISRIPKENILTETDGPFVDIDHNTLLPGQVDSVYKYLSTVWNIREMDVINQIKKNFEVMISKIK